MGVGVYKGLGVYNGIAVYMGLGFVYVNLLFVIYIN
jgi:phage shock protein PspC (stress-responsive transcriptional regulator)